MTSPSLHCGAPPVPDDDPPPPDATPDEVLAPPLPPPPVAVPLVPVLVVEAPEPPEPPEPLLDDVLPAPAPEDAEFDVFWPPEPQPGATRATEAPRNVNKKLRRMACSFREQPYA